MTPTLCIDAGHGGHDPGALGPRMLEEKWAALSVAMMLRDLLRNECLVIMTRETDVFLTLSQRADIANRAGADAFLSIHCNSGPPGLGAGFEVWTSPGQTASDWFATDLYQAFETSFPGMPGRKDLSDGDVDKESKFTVLTRTHMAAALFELEFIHTPCGEGILRSLDNHMLMASALANGVRKYLKLRTGLVTPPVVAKPEPLTDEQKLAEFYASIRDAGNVDQAIKDLTSRGLRELGGYLVRSGATENNVAGGILGRIIVEGWERFAAMKDGGQES